MPDPKPLPPVTDPRQWPPDAEALAQAARRARLGNELLQTATQHLAQMNVLFGQVGEALSAFHTAEQNHALAAQEAQPGKQASIFVLAYVNAGNVSDLRVFLQPHTLLECFHFKTSGQYRNETYPLSAFNQQYRSTQYTYWLIFECTLDGEAVALTDYEFLDLYPQKER